jgi:hypothetical protein
VGRPGDRQPDLLSGGAGILAVGVRLSVAVSKGQGLFFGGESPGEG